MKTDPLNQPYLHTQLPWCQRLMLSLMSVCVCVCVTPADVQDAPPSEEGPGQVLQPRARIQLPEELQQVGT